MREAGVIAKLARDFHGVSRVSGAPDEALASAVTHFSVRSEQRH
jgi:hypothetical protein